MIGMAEKLGLEEKNLLFTLEKEGNRQ